ncbi:hypothetical protein A2415_01230 [candidate division WWE3 bacterium RIFOXYC1_FULL_39_7]|uniref:Uncharacterized protein n=1 Tax=candidate division WWE3 bacterium RIFOXYC1_FULL_39_7 TaxID=1802643 RepID=A0A1F4WLZ9_UNCKA|nr:MAG: hypothetical protein A2415_01230 [candidate division WWE3 bacterium RIFOXYC1_FULL_39_7]
MTELEEKVLEFVQGSLHPVHSNLILEGLTASGTKVSIEEVREAIASLEQRRFLIDAHLPSYFAIG